MSVRFSRVKLVSEDKAAIFLVGGLPRSEDDLKGWTACREFCKDISPKDPLLVDVETFEYGEGERFDATPEEIAYFYMRSEKRPDFVDKRAKKISESSFIIRI